MQLKKWQQNIFYIGVFAVWFILLNLVPFIPIQRPPTVFGPESVICTLNYWSCYHDMIDIDTFPNILKKDIFTIFLLPFFLPLILTLVTVYFSKKRDS